MAKETATGKQSTCTKATTAAKAMLNNTKRRLEAKLSKVEALHTHEDAQTKEVEAVIVEEEDLPPGMMAM